MLKIDEALIFNLKEIMLEASDLVLKIYNQYLDSDLIELQVKSDSSPLTNADIASHDYISRALKKLSPHVPIISEEGLGREAGNFFWLVDPLDGTKEFLNKTHEFTVNIALIKDKKPILGFIFAPKLKQYYWGAQGIGAFLIESQGERSLKINQSKSDIESLKVAVSRNHLNEETRLFVEQLGSVSLVEVGSSLKFCLIADSSLDIYPRFAPTYEWDTAAGQIILEESGGGVWDTSLQNKLSYGKINFLNHGFIATRNLAIMR